MAVRITIVAHAAPAARYASERTALVMADQRPLARTSVSGLLLADLSQLNMLQAGLDAGLTETAVFEFAAASVAGGKACIEEEKVARRQAAVSV